MDTVERENLRDVVLKKKARIAEIEGTLSRRLPTEHRGHPLDGGDAWRLRLEEERQHLRMAIGELEGELARGERCTSNAGSRVNRFGISTDALSEIEETAYNHLDRKALMIEGDSVWQELKQSSPLRVLLVENVAREAASQLQLLFADATREYAEMLTQTILEHHRSEVPWNADVHWSAIADQAVAFCAKHTLWEKSARWLYGPLKAAGLDWKDLTPRTRPAYLTALSAWMLVGPRSLPLLSNEPEAEGIKDLLRRTIRHIVRLAPEKKPFRNGPKLTTGLNASEIRDFHERFMRLADEEERIERVAPGDALLRAYCDYNKHPEIWAEKGKPEQGFFCLLKAPKTGLWTLSNGVNENFQERFRALAAHAAVALGSPEGTDPEDFWLHRLYLDLMENHSDQLFAASNGGGAILQVCKASATFCSRLERKAVTEAGRRRTGDKHAESPPSQDSVNSAQSTLSGEQRSKRLRATVNSPIAAKKMETHLETQCIGLTDFAATVGTTDRTLRSFRKTGKVRRDIFESIAKAMGLTKEALLRE